MPISKNGKYLAESKATVQLGSNMIRIAMRKGLTQAEIARRIPIGRTSIANIEVGRQNISINLLVKIALALRCRVSDLMRGIKP